MVSNGACGKAPVTDIDANIYTRRIDPKLTIPIFHSSKGVGWTLQTISDLHYFDTGTFL
jgi:hypothetical protein